MKKNKEGQLSPHSPIEFELMLKGKKELSFFFGDLNEESSIDARFFLLEDEDPIKKLEVSNHLIHIFYIEGKKWKAEFLLKMIEISLLNKEKILLKEIETIIGTLLGYSSEDIEFYLKHNNIS